jgi:hypothetical protein
MLNDGREAVMSDAKERLNRLIELAAHDAPENRRTLAVELCDLLLDWPVRYPTHMREPFEVLLEKTLRSIDEDTRRALATKCSEREEAPINILNEFYFDATAETRDAIVLRNAIADSVVPVPMDIANTDEASLIAAARGQRQDELLGALVRVFGVEQTTAFGILEDQSGRSLAIACKGAHFSRMTFSTLALLMDAGGGIEELRERLAIFDAVPLTGAERLLDFWRTRQQLAA